MRYAGILILFFVVAACKFGSADVAPAEPGPAPVGGTNSAAANSLQPEISAAVERSTSDRTAADEQCRKVKVGTWVVETEQTFAIDFEPFRGSCFVTSHSREYDDPPLESAYAIYKNGRRVYEFSDQFNGVNFGCWVEAVSFHDLNGDSLTDIIVASRCSGKSAPYNENMVYMNTGKEFATNIDVNYRLADLRTVKNIAEFAKENPQMFAAK